MLQISYLAFIILLTLFIYSNSISNFDGTYSDPNHLGCYRAVSVDNKNVTLIGSDDTSNSTMWKVYGIELTSTEIAVNFSPKGGPSHLLGMNLSMLTIIILLPLSTNVSYIVGSYATPTSTESGIKVILILQY